LEQILELIAATVDVTNDVEGSAILPPVVPERLALDDGSVDFLLGLEDVNVPEALAPEAAQRAVELALLIADNVRAEVAFGPRPIPIVADTLGQVENDGDREHVMLAGERDERLACLRLDVGGVDNRELGSGKPASRHEVKRGEGSIRSKSEPM